MSAARPDSLASVTEGGTTVSQETVTRPCSKCRNDNPDPKHHYCPPCRANYMKERRKVWKARDSAATIAAQPQSEENSGHG